MEHSLSLSKHRSFAWKCRISLTVRSLEASNHSAITLNTPMTFQTGEKSDSLLLCSMKEDPPSSQSSGSKTFQSCGRYVGHTVQSVMGAKREFTDIFYEWKSDVQQIRCAHNQGSDCPKGRKNNLMTFSGFLRKDLDKNLGKDDIWQIENVELDVAARCRKISTLSNDQKNAIICKMLLFSKSIFLKIVSIQLKMGLSVGNDNNFKTFCY